METNSHYDFYRKVLTDLLTSGDISTDSKILVVCAGPSDKECLLSLDFTNVTISNVDERLLDSPTTHFAPYAWAYENAEELKAENASFDICIVHSGLHHCYSPHRAISEMYRVARIGILLFEPHESWFTRLGARLGVGQEYETQAVWGNALKWGGVANTAIPNFVYRFSSWEIHKVISCLQPEFPPQLKFWYCTRANLDFPNAATPVRWLARTLRPILLSLGRHYPALANNFASFVKKPARNTKPQRWLTWQDGHLVPNTPFLEKIYGKRPSVEK
jgi:SAM-dependent methyltransferase